MLGLRFVIITGITAEAGTAFAHPHVWVNVTRENIYARMDQSRVLAFEERIDLQTGLLNEAIRKTARRTKLG